MSSVSTVSTVSGVSLVSAMFESRWLRVTRVTRVSGVSDVVFSCRVGGLAFTDGYFARPYSRARAPSSFPGCGCLARTC